MNVDPIKPTIIIIIAIIINILIEGFIFLSFANNSSNVHNGITKNENIITWIKLSYKSNEFPKETIII